MFCKIKLQRQLLLASNKTKIVFNFYLFLVKFKLSTFHRRVKTTRLIWIIDSFTFVYKFEKKKMFFDLPRKQIPVLQKGNLNFLICFSGKYLS